MERRGLDHKDIDSRKQVRQEWTAGHPRPSATLAQVADHVEHVREVAGADHIGIGGDFDGTDQLPDGLADVSCYPALFTELLGRGWSDADCGRLASGNVLRVMRDAEAAARAISARRGPSVARIDSEKPVS
jgi:membrane dipeptidase